MNLRAKRLIAGVALAAGTIAGPAVAGLAQAAPAVVVAPAHGPYQNGCTLSPDSGPTFNFHAACDAHDLCYHYKPYGNSAAGRKTCDDVFLANMRSSCSARYPYWYQAPLKSTCNGFANTYYTAVRTFGGSFF